MRRPERFQAALVIWRCGTRGSSSAKGLILRAFAAFCPTGRRGYGTLCADADFPGRPDMVWPHGGSQMQDIKYRLVNPGLRPRKTKLEMPGWAGKPAPRTDGSHEYAWHCAPFTEGAQYGIEVFYPYRNELRVSKKDGKLDFEGDFGPRPDDSDLMWPPFRSFGRDYYSYQLLLDLKVDKNWAVRTEPHPRFYTDPTGTVPIAVPALLRTEWWPMISFIVFKSPGEGEV